MPFKFNNNPHCFINVLEMLKDLIKDTCPLISNICWRGTTLKLSLFFGVFFPPRWTFATQTHGHGLQYSKGKEGEKMKPDERAMSGDERSQQQREPTDRYGNEVKRETEIRTFPPLPLCVYPSEKRANKTFIIPGKLFNVFDIKRLRGRRESKRERGGETDGQTDT